jgi:hypothetical protein
MVLDVKGVWKFPIFSPLGGIFPKTTAGVRPAIRGRQFQKATMPAAGWKSNVIGRTEIADCELLNAD